MVEPQEVPLLTNSIKHRDNTCTQGNYNGVY